MSADQQKSVFQYDVAQGAHALSCLLQDYLKQSQADQQFAESDHHILYECGDQRSLIRIETRAIPFSFYYCDLLGRSATRAVKEVIARFLWDQCGEKMLHTQHAEDEAAFEQYWHHLDRNHYFVSAGNMAASLVMAGLRPVVSPLSIEKAYIQLQKLFKWHPSVSSGGYSKGVGLFSTATSVNAGEMPTTTNRFRR